MIVNKKPSLQCISYILIMVFSLLIFSIAAAEEGALKAPQDDGKNAVSVDVKKDVQDAGNNEAQLTLGKKLFGERCVVCHGASGNGKGPAGVIKVMEKSGRVLEIHPRDLTSGTFKFRTVSTGCLPLDEDLLRTITDGILKSFMPDAKVLKLDERKALVAYVKTFSPRFTAEEPCKQIAAKMPKWVGSKDSIVKGEALYKKMKCPDCHGNDGSGNGPKSNDIVDDWGNKILPFNFRTGNLKRGSTPDNVYLTFTTGLDGSGMPSYEDSLKDEERWNLVSFTLKLMNKAEYLK
ncbi:MAG: c-type cytochrome [Nitrospirae bacterium]|nr:c-type cytochrome [Nitrospirota bacterium]